MKEKPTQCNIERYYEKKKKINQLIKFLAWYLTTRFFPS